jgi:hypothetical protein
VAGSKEISGGGTNLIRRTFAPSMKLPVTFSREDQLIVRIGKVVSPKSSSKSREK